MLRKPERSRRSSVRRASHHRVPRAWPLDRRENDALGDKKSHVSEQSVNEIPSSATHEAVRVADAIDAALKDIRCADHPRAVPGAARCEDGTYAFQLQLCCQAIAEPVLLALKQARLD